MNYYEYSFINTIWFSYLSFTIHHVMNRHQQFFCMHKVLEYLLFTTPLLKEGNGVLTPIPSEHKTDHLGQTLLNFIF